jgi:UDP-N-acetylmuramate dehydrogenase
MEIIQKIKKSKIGKIVTNAQMSKYTTYRVGGIALAIVYPKNIEKLIKLIKILKEDNIKYKVLGNGSNVIFSDDKYEGIVINLNEFKQINIKGTVIKLGAGNNLISISNKLSKMGYTGLEFATGIPGTIGGAIYMNAGAYKSDMGYIVSEVRVLTTDFKIQTFYNKDLNFHYGSSFLQENEGYICLEATVVLKHGNKKAIMALIEERRKKRLMSQPWD